MMFPDGFLDLKRGNVYNRFWLITPERERRRLEDEKASACYLVGCRSTSGGIC